MFPILCASRHIDVETNVGDADHMKVLTIGYGGPHPEEFITILKENWIVTMVDLRLLPERTRFGRTRRQRRVAKAWRNCCLTQA